MLFTFKAVAASASVRIAVAGITHVNFAKGAIIPHAVVLTFGYAATDGSVHFLIFVFIHHKNPPFFPIKSILSDFSEKSMGNFSKVY